MILFLLGNVSLYLESLRRKNKDEEDEKKNLVRTAIQTYPRTLKSFIQQWKENTNALNGGAYYSLGKRGRKSNSIT